VSIEILRELVPDASKIALLVNPNNPIHRLALAEEAPRAARNLGVALLIVEATTPEEIDAAFASAAAQHADAIVDLNDRLTNFPGSASCRTRSEASSARELSFQTAYIGGLIVYGPNVSDRIMVPPHLYSDSSITSSEPSRFNSFIRVETKEEF
jgi:putative tryptophan/tyrosine transport system substrate-binding protein